MRTFVLTTDGGPHSHEDWAVATATMIVAAFAIKPGSPRTGRLEILKDRARADIADVMVKHHHAVQSKERDMVGNGGDERLSQFKWEISPHEHTDFESACADVRRCCQPLLDACNSCDVTDIQGHPIEGLRFEDELMRVIRLAVHNDLAETMHIERSWHADRHPDTEHSRSFRWRRIASGHPNPAMDPDFK